MLREFLINTAMGTDLFFKRRYILSSGSTVPPRDRPARITIHRTIPHHAWDFLTENRDPSRMEKQSEDPDMILALAEIEGEIVGNGWLLNSQKTVWHSKLPVYPHEALLFGAYVKPEYRRQGISSQLHAARRNIGLEHARRVITQIDSRNKPSLAANASLGMEPLSTNYLVKFLGINLLSIERGGRSYASIYVDVPSLSSIKRQFHTPD